MCAVLAFAYQFDFPPVMVLIITLLNDGTVSCPRTLRTPGTWPRSLPSLLPTVAMSTITLVIAVLESERDANGHKDHKDRQLHMIVDLQVAVISQALIFVTRSHGFFMGRPSTVLLGAFAVPQLVSSIIAAYADWGFTDIHSVSGSWISFVWVWNIVRFFPLDWIKFGMKATIIKWFRERKAAEVARATGGEVPLTCNTSRATLIPKSLEQ